MLYFLKVLSLLFLLNYHGHAILAHQTLLGRIPKRSAIAASNFSAASLLNKTHISYNITSSAIAGGFTIFGPALPAPFPSNKYDPKGVTNYQDIKSGFCAIGDDFCSFKESNGTIIEAPATNISDQCLLWDPSCTGNRTLAIQKFFDIAFANAYIDGMDVSENGKLLDNDCFVLNGVINQSDCDRYNPLKRLSDFGKIKDWMRSQQCVAAADKWMAMTGNSWQDMFEGRYVLDGGVNGSNYDVDENSDPNSLSCRGTCNVWAQNVDLYYWIEPDTNLSCLSIIGKSSNLPLEYGATTATGIDSQVYWACTTTSSGTIKGEPGVSTTATYIVTTAEITTIGSLTVKLYDVNPWSSPCRNNLATSQSLNRSTPIHDRHAWLYARNHSLLLPSSITQAGGLPASTMVSGNFTFTSPSVYANFHGLKAYDSCGGVTILSTMIAFAPGELATIDGPLQFSYFENYNDRQLKTKSMDFRDLPCPPQSVIEANWYKPQPGEPYRPLIAMPSKLKGIEPWFQYCQGDFFTAYDPPSALTAVTALAPPIPPSDPKTHPWAPVPSPTLDPGAKQKSSPESSISVPASIPTVDQAKATKTAAPVPPKQEGNSPESQPDDPATSQSRTNTVNSNKDSQGSNDPEQGNNPTQVSGSSGDSGEELDPKPNSDPIQVNNNHEFTQDADPAPQNDPKQADGANIFNAFTEGQVKTINDQLVQPLSHGISIAGTTLTPRAPPITISGTSIHFGPSDLIIGTSTIPLAPGDPNLITTNIAGHIITAAPGAIAVADSTLTPGAPPVTVSGTPIQLGSSGLIIGTSTVPLVPESPTKMTTTIAGQAITAAPNSVAIAGNTLSPGAPGTIIDGTVLSIDTVGQFIVGSKTIPFASDVPETITTTVAGQVITAAPDGIAVAGTTLQPGAPGTTLSGTLISLNTASQLIVGSKTIPLESASPNSIVATIGGQVITAAPNGLAITGNSLSRAVNGTSANVQAFEGSAANSISRSLWKKMAASVIAMSVLAYMC